MQDEKWEELIETAKKHFQNVSLTVEDLIKDTPEGEQVEGAQEILEFKNAGGHFRVVRENRPVVLEKKQFFSHRMGDTARSEYKFSDTEFSHKLKVYKEVDFDEWEEMTLSSLGM